MSLPILSLQWLLDQESCWGADRIREAWGQPTVGHTIVEIMDGADTNLERIWLWTRPGAVPRAMLLEWLARLVERALARADCHSPSSVEVVAALRADSVTDEVLSASGYAATAAAATDAADADATCASDYAADSAAAATAYAAYAAAAADYAAAYASDSSAAAAYAGYAAYAAAYATYAADAAYDAAYAADATTERAQQVADATAERAQQVADAYQIARSA